MKKSCKAKFCGNDMDFIKAYGKCFFFFTNQLIQYILSIYTRIYPVYDRQGFF